MSNPKQNQNNQSQTTTLSPSQYSTALSTTAISQLLRSLGFKSSKSSALTALSRLTNLFIHSLATTAAAHAASCNRSHSNLFDIIHAIEVHNLPFGYSGAADVDRPLLDSGVVQELMYFVSAIDEVPFPRRRRLSDSFCCSSSFILAGKFEGSENDRRGFEVPRWLPPFPAVRDGGCGGGRSGKECLWEEKKVECGAAREKKVKKRGKEVVVQGRRERIKFRLGRRNSIANAGCGGGGGVLDDLELRNGVCRGGKIVCLIKNVRNDISRIFQDDAL